MSLRGSIRLVLVVVLSFVGLTTFGIEPALAECNRTGEACFGPVDGDLIHGPGDSLVVSSEADVSVADFVATVTFVNPYAAEDGSWDYGFFFRDTGRNMQFRIVVTSRGRYSFRYGVEESARSSGDVPSLDVSAGAANALVLIVQGGTAHLLVNGEYIGEPLDISSELRAGDVSVVTGTFTGNEQKGAVTRYEGFTIWELESAFGPTSGTLAHNTKDGVVTQLNAGLSLTNVLVNVVFGNPYGIQTGGFDFGLFIRNDTGGTAQNNTLGLAVSSDSRWRYYYWAESTPLSQGTVTNLDTTEGGTNAVLLLAIGDVGWFFLNGDFVAELDLSRIQDSGDVSLLTGAFRENEIDGQATMYEGFEVFALR